MPAGTTAFPPEICQIKVTLRGATPAIWRRLLVPADITLEKLHSVLQITMGWQDCHMHEYLIGKTQYGIPDTDMNFPGMQHTVSEKKARLSAVLPKVGAKALYTYDFGDGWDHNILVEKILAREPERAYPFCVAGKRHCPPEDCGGVYGYENLLATLADPGSEDYENMREWIGGNFDPESFSADAVNRALAPRRARVVKS